MQIKISRAHHAELIALTDTAPAHEVCGLLFGDALRISGFLQTANVAANPEGSFEIDPVALIAAHKAARAGGPQVLGCFHSHPNGRADPSARDIAAAQGSGEIWVIIADGAATAWRSEAALELRPVELLLTDC